MKKTVWTSFDQLESFMVDVFKSIGVPESDAAVCADVLINSDKRGIDSVLEELRARGEKV